MASDLETSLSNLCAVLLERCRVAERSIEPAVTHVHGIPVEEWMRVHAWIRMRRPDPPGWLATEQHEQLVTRLESIEAVLLAQRDAAHRQLLGVEQKSTEAVAGLQARIADLELRPSYVMAVDFATMPSDEEREYLEASCALAEAHSGPKPLWGKQWEGVYKRFRAARAARKPTEKAGATIEPMGFPIFEMKPAYPGTWPEAKPTSSAVEAVAALVAEVRSWNREGHRSHSYDIGQLMLAVERLPLNAIESLRTTSRELQRANGALDRIERVVVTEVMWRDDIKDILRHTGRLQP